MSNDQPIFKYVFGEKWENLPLVMRNFYANRPDCKEVVMVEGKMDIGCSRMMRLLFPIFKFFKVLVPYQGKNIPVTINLCSNLNSSVLHFNRTFKFSDKKLYYFNSYMLPIKKNVVVEFVFLGLGWRTVYICKGNKVILKHNGYVWKLFGLLIPLPLSLLLGKIDIEKEAISDNLFHLKMKIAHLLFGEYWYSGEFKIIDLPFKR
jgi:Domain of unknown function (DUF4166)